MLRGSVCQCDVTRALGERYHTKETVYYPLVLFTSFASHSIGFSAPRASPLGPCSSHGLALLYGI